MVTVAETVMLMVTVAETVIVVTMAIWVMS